MERHQLREQAKTEARKQTSEYKAKRRKERQREAKEFDKSMDSNKWDSEVVNYMLGQDIERSEMKEAKGKGITPNQLLKSKQPEVKPKKSKVKQQIKQVKEKIQEAPLTEKQKKQAFNKKLKGIAKDLGVDVSDLKGMFKHKETKRVAKVKQEKEHAEYEAQEEKEEQARRSTIKEIGDDDWSMIEESPENMKKMHEWGMSGMDAEMGGSFGNFLDNDFYEKGASGKYHASKAIKSYNDTLKKDVSWDMVAHNYDLDEEQIQKLEKAGLKPNEIAAADEVISDMDLYEDWSATNPVDVEEIKRGMELYGTKKAREKTRARYGLQKEARRAGAKTVGDLEKYAKKHKKEALMSEWLKEVKMTIVKFSEAIFPEKHEIKSKAQQRLFGAVAGGKATKAKGLSVTKAKEHLRESKGKKLPKRIKIKRQAKMSEGGTANVFHAGTRKENKNMLAGTGTPKLKVKKPKQIKTMKIGGGIVKVTKKAKFDEDVPVSTKNVSVTIQDVLDKQWHDWDDLLILGYTIDERQKAEAYYLQATDLVKEYKKTKSKCEVKQCAINKFEDEIGILQAKIEAIKNDGGFNDSNVSTHISMFGELPNGYEMSEEAAEMHFSLFGEYPACFGEVYGSKESVPKGETAVRITKGKNAGKYFGRAKSAGTPKPPEKEKENLKNKKNE